MIGGDNIGCCDEQWPTHLWKDVQNAMQGRNTYMSTPMEELDIGHDLPLDQGSLYANMRLEKSNSSANETLPKLPQVLGDHEANFKIKTLPYV